MTRTHASKAALLGVACAVAAVTLAGCSAGTPKPTPRPTAVIYQTHGGQSAATLATHVHGCGDIQAVALTGTDDKGLQSVATCRIDGHIVVFDAFTTATTASGTETMSMLPEQMWYTGGPGWMAFTADQEGIRLAAEDSTQLLQWQFAHPNGDGTPDIAGEKDVANVILKSLSGHVEHQAAQ